MASPGLNLNMNDPRVRQSIDPSDSRLAPGKREMVQLAGDSDTAGWAEIQRRKAVLDPSGASRNVGIESTVRLDGGKIEVLVAYRGKVGDYDLTVDVYALPGEPITLHVICPKCRHQSRISGDRKKIEFEPNRARPYVFVDGSKYITNGGALFVEPFKCSWEMPEAGEHKQVDRLGMTLCGLVLAIDNSIAKDA